MKKEELVENLGKIVRIKEIKEIKKDENIFVGYVELENEKIESYVVENEVLNTGEGKIIGVIIFKKEKKNFLVIGKNDSKLNYATIKGFFRDRKEFKGAKYRCLYEKSTGIIAYQKENNLIKYLIMYGKKGMPGFPKGHMEFGETEEETAKREFKEEIGFDLNINSNFRDEVFYMYEDTPINKHVVFFLSEVKDFSEINVNEKEVNMKY